jgi:hypothetical protein
MGQTWRACAAFGAVLLIAACSPAATPSGAPTSTRLPTATATASGAAASSPTPVVFASKRYPYSITLPIGWVATPAGRAWDGTGLPTSDDPAADVFEPIVNGVVGKNLAFVVAAPTRSLLAAWVADDIATTFRLYGDTCPQTPDSVEPVTIGGQPGTLVAWNCGILINAAFTVANGYGYRFVFRDQAIPAATDPADHATFTTMLGSVVFH